MLSWILCYYLPNLLHLYIRLNDPELVGEFLQCLKIMEIDSWRDEDIW